MDRRSLTLIFFCLAIQGFVFLGVSRTQAIDITNSVTVEVLPNPPTNLSATANSSSQISLAWTDNSTNEQGFNVERKTDLTGTYSVINSVSPNIASYVDNSVSVNTTYYYRVNAFLGNAASSYSNEASATTPAAPQPPAPPPSSGGSGGGGGGGGGSAGGFPPSYNTSVVFRGIAYPNSDITLLKDAQVAAVIKAGGDAHFEITLSGLSSGTYNFSVWAEDSRGNHSITQVFTVSITAGATNVVSGIFIAPTISIDKSEIKRGDILTVLGQTAPSSTVSIFIGSVQEITKSTNSDDSGLWKYNLDTSELDYGDHSARARATQNGEFTTFSQSAGFKVGTKTVLTPTAKKPGYEKADFSGDGHVNLVDFSILSYWYNRPIPQATAAKIDLNQDGKVNLIDFSIMAYYWTG